MFRGVVHKDAWRWRARPKESKNGKGLLSAPTQNNQALPEIDHRLPRVRMQLLEDLAGGWFEGRHTGTEEPCMSGFSVSFCI